MARFDQDRFNELVLYIAHKTNDDKRFGRTKLAKVLFYSDLDAYRDRGETITGATYIRMPFGPFPKQLKRAEEVIAATGRAKLDYDVPDHVEKKIYPTEAPRDLVRLGYGDADVFTVDSFIKSIGEMTAKAVSDQTHREPGWILAGSTGAEIPLAVAFLPDRPPSRADLAEAERLARERGTLTDAGWQWEREQA